MKFKINWLILFYISLGLCLKVTLPGELGFSVYDHVVDKGLEKGFDSYVDLNFTLEDCKSMNLCPKSMEYGEEFIRNLLTLDMFEVFTYALNKNEDKLRRPINDTAYWYEYSTNEYRGESIGKHAKPQKFHYSDKYKLIITVPIYLACSAIAVIVYLNKRKLLVTINFKFSNISRILFKYLSVKLVFGTVYLIYLVLFDDFSMKQLGNYKVLVAFTIIKYILTVTSFLLIILFAFGYSISFFTFTNRRPVLWKVGGLTLLYGIQCFPKFYYELQDMKNEMPSHFTMFRSRLPMPVAVAFIILYVVILCALTYIVYDTYKHTIKRDPRFLLSFQIILAAYILSPLIVIPYGRSTIPNFIKNKYLLNDRGASEAYSHGIHVPDVIELFVIGALIYIWRDLKYVENDGNAYDKLDNDEYELENIH